MPLAVQIGLLLLAQAASSAGASPETPTAPIRSRPSAEKTGTPPPTVTT